MGFSRQEYSSGLPFPSPGDRPDHGIEPGSPVLEADALTSEPPGKPWWVGRVDSAYRLGPYWPPWCELGRNMQSDPVKKPLTSLPN